LQINSSNMAHPCTNDDLDIIRDSQLEITADNYFLTVPDENNHLERTIVVPSVLLESRHQDNSNNIYNQSYAPRNEDAK
jgi:hypothetical protein